MTNFEIVTKAMAVLETAEYGSDVYELAIWSAHNAMDSGQRETLQQLLFKGPVWDGDILSKNARGDLFKWGLAARCCYKGEQGFSVATYRGYSVHKCLEN